MKTSRLNPPSPRATLANDEAALSLVERMHRNPEYVGICQTIGVAHDYLFIGELIQLHGGRFLRRVWNELGGPPPMKSSSHDLDLEAEFVALETAPEPPATGGRVVFLKIAVTGTDGEPHRPNHSRERLEEKCYQFERPLSDSRSSDHPARRLFQANWDKPSDEG